MNLQNLQYCSELHLEFPVNKQFIQKNPIVPKNNLLVLAGDSVPFHLIEKISSFKLELKLSKVKTEIKDYLKELGL